MVTTPELLLPWVYILLASHNILEDFNFINTSLNNLIASIPFAQRLKDILWDNDEVNIKHLVIFQPYLMTWLQQFLVVYSFLDLFSHLKLRPVTLYP